MLARRLTTLTREALKDRPVVLVHGARQTGKTTLVRLAAPRHEYLTLDDAAVYSAASADSDGFLDGLHSPVILDEVQRVPALFTAIKRAVDDRRVPGRFLLTGSADAMLLPRLGDSLAGRMEVLQLLTLSQGEIEGRRENFLASVFRRKLDVGATNPVDRREAARRIVTGGYPEVVTSIKPSRRSAWFGSYLTAVLQRDVLDLSRIDDLPSLPRLLGLVASRTSGILNYADLSRSLSMPQTTLKRFFALLEATFLVRVLPAWSSNLGLRLVKAPKVLVADTGLAAHLLGADEDRLRREGSAFGALLESFVAMELAKQASWNSPAHGLFHFRTAGGAEADLVLESPSGELVGIEVKAGAGVTPTDFRGLHALADAGGERFVRGIVLYTGSSVVPFGANFHAVPISALWET